MRLAFWLDHFQAFKFQQADLRRFKGEDSISQGFITAKGRAPKTSVDGAK